MKYFSFFFLLLLLSSCEEEPVMSSIAPVNWKSRAAELPLDDSLSTGTTYLSIYSQIYSRSELRTHNLTATVSMRNTNVNDSIFVLKADYYNTKGNLIRTYFKNPIVLMPMETVEIVIDESDQEGGTGANFIFDWKKPESADDPFFEGVMISTSGQQGISFTTHGRKLRK